MVIGQVYHIYNSINKINQYNVYVEYKVIHLSSAIFPFVHFHICYLLVFDMVPGTKQLLNKELLSKIVKYSQARKLIIIFMF